jgi:hypothetical protein
MARLNTDRQEKLEPLRVATALSFFGKLKTVSDIRSSARLIEFTYNGNVIKYFPYSGWATGVGIEDGRGLQNLLNQLV